MWRDLGTAIALMLVIEGLLPFANPSGLRAMLHAVAELSDRQIRITGFVSMFVGVFLLYLVK